MVSLLRVVVAVLLGFVAGSAVNMGLILASGHVIPPPPGADVTTMEGLQASLPLFEPRHFLFPFLAHAVGTLVGAFVASWLVPGESSIAAASVGALFLAGGIANVALLPAPMWFSAVDLLMAYAPPAWFGRTLAMRRRGGHADA